MPIKPENRARYPANWKQIRKQILERARHQCEHQGCSARNHQVGYWEVDGSWMPMPERLREAGYQPGDVVASSRGDFKIIRIILTIAHLDHTPENCDPDNLRAWCQRHHLAYDAKHHAVTAARTRHAKANTVELFE